MLTVGLTGSIAVGKTFVAELLREAGLHVLDAEDAHGHDVSLVHEDTVPLRRMAVFDVLVNNADRKGGHVLAMADGHRYGVDHGVCFHVEDKLRTVLWGWVGQPLPDDVVEGLEKLRAELDGAFSDVLGEHITRREVRTLAARVNSLLSDPRFPEPSGYGPAIPWPAF